MPRKQPIYFRGQWYKSMAAAARAHGLKPNTLYKAKLEGRLDQVGRKRRGNPTRVRLNGIDFATINEAARYFGVHRTAITRVLNKGLDTFTPKGIAVKVGRLEFDSIKACAEHFGVSRHVIYRLRETDNLDSLLPPEKPRPCMNCGKPVNQGTHLCDRCRRQSSGLS